MQNRRDLKPRSSRICRILQTIEWVGRGQSLRQLRLLCIFADVRYLVEFSNGLLTSIDLQKYIVDNADVHADSLHESHKHDSLSFVELQFVALEDPERQTPH